MLLRQPSQITLISIKMRIVMIAKSAYQYVRSWRVEHFGKVISFSNLD
jgi:hypothetical protein